MVTYEKDIIKQYAERLYREASRIMLFYFLFGLLVGGILASYIMSDYNSIGVVAIIAGLFGYLIAREKAFKLKLTAQLALCQVKIEENTLLQRKTT